MTSLGQRKRAVIWLEIVSTALMGLSAIATSWSGYQAARWSGVQAAKYNEAEMLRIESAQASGRASFLRVIDVTSFGDWLQAYAEKRDRLAAFYRQRLRPEFTPAFEQWLAANPADNANAAATPFALPAYRLAEEERALDLQAQARDAARVAQAANERSDKYVLNAVIFAVALFFLGMANQARWALRQALIVLIALGMCVYGGLLLASYPVE